VHIVVVAVVVGGDGGTSNDECYKAFAVLLT
jgi:hypothetical protein